MAAAERKGEGAPLVAARFFFAPSAAWGSDARVKRSFQPNPFTFTSLPFPSTHSPCFLKSHPIDLESDFGDRVPANTEMEDTPAGGGDGAVTTPPPAPTCPVSMEPWTCNGDHLICCIPRGHVYGRSCLERWLRHSSESAVKCPQCGEQFEHKLITNLYAPGNLWDGCCRLQEVQAHCQSEVREIREENAGSLTGMREKILEISALVIKSKEVTAEFAANVKADTEFLHAAMRQKIDQIKRMKRVWSKEKATAKANLTTMKQRMKKMAEEEKATATDLIEFMELSFPQLPLFSENPQASASAASASAPAPVDAQNNTRRRSNQPDQLPPVPSSKKKKLPPVPEPPGPADAVNGPQASGSAPAPVDAQNSTRRRSNRPDQLPPVPEPPGPAADAVNKRRR